MGAPRRLFSLPRGEPFPMHADPAMRISLMQAMVAGIALVLRRRTGQWPTTCDVLYWLAAIGLDITDTDDTPEALRWLHYGQRQETQPPDDPFGVLLWDEGPDGLVRVVVPADLHDQVSSWLAEGES